MPEEMYIRQQAYAKWLEDTLEQMVPMAPKVICFCAILPGGEVATSYYNADAADKAIIAHNIHSDCMLDVMMANAKLIVDAAQEQEDNT